MLSLLRFRPLLLRSSAPELATPPSLLQRLKRHPFSVQAHFSHSLVLTYALPQRVLRPLLPPGLQLDTFKEWGFVAIALVQTQSLRPVFLPAALGQDFFLSGYRIFSKFTTRTGRHLRGLRILRSDTDRRIMALSGNMLTHYNYRLAKVNFRADAKSLNISVQTPNSEADLEVFADLSSRPAPLPDGSPFPNLETARHFAGPLPFTFDYEAATHSMIIIKGVRKKWDPQPIRVDVGKCTFFDGAEFDGVQPILANAFHIEDVPYRWEVGRCELLQQDVKP